MSDLGFKNTFADASQPEPTVLIRYLAAPQKRDSSPANIAQDLKDEPGLQGHTLVTWGDSTAYLLGINLRAMFNDVVNLGRNGAGLDNILPPNALGKLPENAVVIISMGGNDVEGMIGKPDDYIESYAKRVIGIAKAAKAQGATPILIGHSIPPAPYTGPVPGGVSHWQEDGFYGKWVATLHKVNAAISSAAAAENITWSETESRIPLNERAKDNLHFNARGSRHVAANALKDAGFIR